DAILVVPYHRPEFLTGLALPLYHIREYHLYDSPLEGLSFGTYDNGHGVLVPDVPAPDSAFNDPRLTALFAAIAEHGFDSFLAYLKGFMIRRRFLRAALRYMKQQRSRGIVVFMNGNVDADTLRGLVRTRVRVINMNETTDTSIQWTSRHPSVTIIQNLSVTHSDFMRLIDRVSGPFIGCRGGSSIMEVLFTGRILYYELPHQMFPLMVMCAQIIKRINADQDTHLSHLFHLFIR
ncbi:hypothetical protein BVRB_033790, partial [Beta vulgaris subsp. vulgaris]